MMLMREPACHSSYTQYDEAFSSGVAGLSLKSVRSKHTSAIGKLISSRIDVESLAIPHCDTDAEGHQERQNLAQMHDVSTKSHIS